MAAGMQLPPFRSLQDVLTDAKFTIPTLSDLERMSNRIANNLLYYQTNYFLWCIVIFLILGTLYPKDMIIGALSVAVALVVYARIFKEIETGRHDNTAYYCLVSAGVAGVILLLIYVLGSVLVFLWGVVAPISVVFMHASCRKRNLRNKITNVKGKFQENPSPMSIVLSMLNQPLTWFEDQTKPDSFIHPTSTLEIWTASIPKRVKRQEHRSHFPSD